MVGLIHECLFGFLARNFGPEAIPVVKRKAAIEDVRQFRIDTIYADDEWRRLLDAAVELSGHDRATFGEAFARYCGEDLVVRFPGFLRGVGSARDIIERQPAIHNSIAASMRAPEQRRQIRDKFRVEARSDRTIVHYVSPNQMCWFYKGLAGWVAEHTAEVIALDEPRCQLRGDDECEIHVRYLGPRDAAARAER